MSHFMDTLYATFCTPGHAGEYEHALTTAEAERDENLRHLWPLVDAQPGRTYHKFLFRLTEAYTYLIDVRSHIAFASGLRLGIRIGEALSAPESP